MRIRMILALCLLVVTAGAASAYYSYTDPAGFSYNSAVNDGVLWEQLRNERDGVDLVTWRWAGGTVGLWPGAESLEASFPLPGVESGIPRPWYNVATDCTDVVTVTSWLEWADGMGYEVPVYVPTALVPEPSGLLALAIGAAGLLARRRR